MLYVICFRVFLSNNKILHLIIWFKQLFLCNNYDDLFVRSYKVSSIPIQYNWFSKRSIGPIDGSQTGSTILNQSWPERNINEGIFYTHRAPKLVPHYQMQFSVIPRTRFWKGSVLPLYRGSSWPILAPTDKAAVCFFWYFKAFSSMLVIHTSFNWWLCTEIFVSSSFFGFQ